MFETISVGSAAWDVFVKVPEARKITTTEFVGQQALAFPLGVKVEVETQVATAGGGGTNTAVALARLGLKAAVLARCGWDLPGRQIRQQLKQEGVDDSLLLQLEKELTDYSTILIGPEGKSTILVYRGPTRLEASLVDFNRLQAKWFCISNLEGNLDLLAALIKHAQKNKIKIALNPGKRELEQEQALLPLLAQTNLLVVNHQEAALLLGEKEFSPRLGRKMARLTPGLVAVTQGAEGAYLFDAQDKLLKADGFKVEMVDSTGAGDAFFAGLVAGLAQNWELEKALKLAVANGAAVTTAIGAKAALLTCQTAPNWLEKPLKIR